MNELYVSGRTSGGSSYTQRIVRAMNKSPEPLRIFVSSGAKQHLVVQNMEHAINELEIFTGRILDCVVIKDA